MSEPVTAGQAPGTEATTTEATTTQDASATTEATTTTEPEHKGAPTWEMVEELRAENARRRVSSKQFEDAFSGYQPDERDALLDIAKQLADPNLQPAAAKRLQTIASEILKDADSGVARRPTGEEDPADKPLTRREWEKLQADRDAEAASKEGMAAIYRDMEKLGYPDSNSEDSRLLLGYATNEANGDLNKAHEMVQAWKEKLYTAHAEEVAAGRNKWLQNPSSAGGVLAGQGEAPKSFKDASAALREMLRAQPR